MDNNVIVCTSDSLKRLDKYLKKGGTSQILYTANFVAHFITLGSIAMSTFTPTYYIFFLRLMLVGP